LVDPQAPHWKLIFALTPSFLIPSWPYD